MKTKQEIINNLITERNYKKYLEIGVGAGTNLNQIVCDSVEGVDPEASKYIGKHKVTETTSDEFLSTGKTKWDIIFIDGLHHADQVERDIINSLKRLKKGGCLVVHDVCPPCEEMTVVPRGAQKMWTGDVYKTFFALHAMDGIETHYHTCDFGVGIIEYTDVKLQPGFSLDISFKQYEESYLHGNN